MGHQGVIGPGDAQWLKAASGVIHSEMPPQSGARLPGVQKFQDRPGQRGAFGRIGAAAQLVELWTATLEEGQSPPDVEGNLTALQGGLAASERRVAEADQRHVRQLAVTMGLRQQIREVHARIYRKLSKIRRVMDELHGEGKAFVLASILGTLNANVLLGPRIAYAMALDHLFFGGVDGDPDVAAEEEGGASVVLGGQGEGVGHGDEDPGHPADRAARRRR